MIDLHELANMPGAGKAKDALIKAGHWDEWKGMAYKEYAVEYTVEFSGERTVRARSEAEAEIKACEELATLHDCDKDDIEIGDVSEEK